MKKANIYIINGGLTDYISTLIIDSSADSLVDHILFDFKRQKQYSRADVSSRYLRHTYATLGISNYFRAVRGFKQQLAAYEKTYDQIDFYMSNIVNFAANHIFFTWKKGNRVLVPEGTSHYCLSPVKENMFANMKQKRLLGYLAGLSYHPYEGHISGHQFGYDKTIRVNGISSFTETGEIVPISFESKQMESKGRQIIIFADQDVEKEFPDLAPTMREKSLEFLNQYPEAKVFYKPHPAQLEDHYEFYKTHLPNVEKVDMSVSAETVLLQENATMAVSFFSSFLFTSKLIFKNLSCVAVGLDHILKIYPDMEDLYNIVGVDTY